MVLASFPGLPRFYLLFAFTIIHGSRRPGLDPRLTSVVLCRDHVHPKPLTARNKQSQIPWAYFQNMEGPMRLQDWRSVHNIFLRATKFCSSPRVSLAPWELRDYPRANPLCLRRSVAKCLDSCYVKLATNSRPSLAQETWFTSFSGYETMT